MELRANPTPDQWRQIHEICCLTADSGKPIARERWELFGRYWIAPYRRLLPTWTWVALDPAAPPGEEVAGYLTGCPRTLGYERKRFWLWDLPLVAEILATPRYRKHADGKRFMKRLLGLTPTPEHLFSRPIQSRIHREFPAHLHINLREKYRGAGLGTRLTQAFLNRLREERVPGLHVHCGAAPLGFYQNTGFSPIAELELRPGVFTYALGKRVP